MVAVSTAAVHIKRANLEIASRRSPSEAVLIHVEHPTQSEVEA